MCVCVCVHIILPYLSPTICVLLAVWRALSGTFIWTQAIYWWLFPIHLNLAPINILVFSCHDAHNIKLYTYIHTRSQTQISAAKHCKTFVTRMTWEQVYCMVRLAICGSVQMIGAHDEGVSATKGITQTVSDSDYSSHYMEVRESWCLTGKFGAQLPASKQVHDLSCD